LKLIAELELTPDDKNTLTLYKGGERVVQVVIDGEDLGLLLKGVHEFAMAKGYSQPKRFEAIAKHFKNNEVEYIVLRSSRRPKFEFKVKPQDLKVYPITDMRSLYAGVDVTGVEFRVIAGPNTLKLEQIATP